MFSIILVATDGSRESLVAVRAAAKEALLHKAVLHTVCGKSGYREVNVCKSPCECYYCGL